MSNLTHGAQALMLAGCLACTSQVDKADSSGQVLDPTDSGGPGSDDGEGGDEGGGSGGGPSPDQAPQVLDGDIWCYEHSTGEVRYYWTLVAQAMDPQGNTTLQALHEGLTAWQGGNLLATYAVVCSSGSCTASFEEVEDNVLCASASTYEFKLEVVDDDGNLSAPYTMNGRVGTNASGR